MNPQQTNGHAHALPGRVPGHDRAVERTAKLVRDCRSRARICAACALIVCAWTAAAVTVSIEAPAGAPGTRVLARVVVDRAAGLAGGAFRLRLPDFATVEVPAVTADTTGFLLASRADRGHLAVSMARAAGLRDGPATLFTVPLRIAPDAPQGTFALAWEQASLFGDTAMTVAHQATPGLLTVLPPPVDLDRDGLPDDWENERLGPLPSGTADDPDLDGSSNYAEFLAGTDPASADSVLRVSGLEQRGPDGLSAIVLTWEADPTRDYEVYWSPGPVGPQMTWRPIYRPVYHIEGTRLRWVDDGTRTYGIPRHDAARYYQVRVLAP